MLMKQFVFLLVFVALLCSSAPTRAQDLEGETVRVRTRVVFIDTLVRDKKTAAPVADLTRENFEVFADGKPRTLSYFSRAGEGRRRPLALVLIIDELVATNPDESLRRSKVLASLGSALRKLAPEDEVAIMANIGGATTPLKMLADFTRDQAKVAEALAAIGSLSKPQPRWYRDELENVLTVVEQATMKRPDSQIVVVTLTTIIGPINFSQRDKIVGRLLRANTLYSPLIRNPGNASIKMKNVPGKMPLPPRPIVAAIGRLVGTDNYAPAHIAEQTGGEAQFVKQAEDYGAALENLLSNLAARYNLGFTLKESEQDDGRMHKLQVRTKVRDANGKERKFIVLARRGYYAKMQGAPVTK
jgi:VWFA-related protein